MRLLKISQSMTFQEDTFYRTFKKDQVVTFSGYLKQEDEIVTGYLKQEPINCNSLVFYVKGHWETGWKSTTRDAGELVFVATTKSNLDYPITLCSYLPCISNLEGKGYLDESNGCPSHTGQYFFKWGNYIAQTHIQLEKIPDEEYAKIEKKMNQMLNRLFVAKEQNQLNDGYLFDFIQPNWRGARYQLIDIYPKPL